MHFYDENDLLFDSTIWKWLIYNATKIEIQSLNTCNVVMLWTWHFVSKISDKAFSTAMKSTKSKTL